MDDSQLHADGLLLRPFQDADAAPFVAAVRESAEGMQRWMPWSSADYSVAQALEWFQACRDGWAAGSACEYGIFEQDTAAFVGGAGLNKIDHLQLRLQPPRTLPEPQQRLAYFQRSGGAIAAHVDAQPARGGGVAVVAALHHHRVQVAAGTAGAGPVHTHVLVIQPGAAYRHVFPADRSIRGGAEGRRT